MAVDFAVICPRVRPGRSRVRFLSVGTRLCFAVPSGSGSRRMPLCFANPSPRGGGGLALPGRWSCSAHEKRGGAVRAPPPMWNCSGSRSHGSETLSCERLLLVRAERANHLPGHTERPSRTCRSRPAEHHRRRCSRKVAGPIAGSSSVHVPPMVQTVAIVISAVARNCQSRPQLADCRTRSV